MACTPFCVDFGGGLRWFYSLGLRIALRASVVVRGTDVMFNDQGCGKSANEGYSVIFLLI